MPRKSEEKSKKKDLIKRVRERYTLMVEADQENRRNALDDMKFVNIPGEQWDHNMKQERGDRPCYEFNKCRVNGKKVINEIRANRPSGKVRGVEGGDKKTAEIYEGLIRNIWNMSDGDTIIDYAAEYQVDGGMGAWRVTTDYTSEEAFYQDIKIEAIHNPYCLFADPSAKDILKRDATDWILTERISIEAYEKKWPKAEKVDFDSTEFDDNEEWMSDETVRICEYWYKEQAKKTLFLLTDGKVVDSESDEGQNLSPEMIQNQREVKCDKIYQVIVSGDAILEGPNLWAGKHFPFVMVYGEYMVIDGKTYWWGLHRFARDAQQSYNVSRTSITETIAMAPQAKYWATPGQAEGHTDKWAEAHRKNFPFLLFNPDPKSPGTPQRMGGADVPIALIQEAQMASGEIDATSGIFGDDRGQETRSQSGRAIYARQQQGQIVTFNYPDNMSKGIRRTWEILVDLIPKIYDTERDLRVLGADGAEDYIKVNTFVQDRQTGEMIKIHDLNQGRYDVTISIGPSFTTKRQEASEIYMQLTQQAPQIMGIAGDLVFKSMDLPYAEEISERLKAMLPPQIQELINKDKQVPQEVQAMMMQAQQAMQMVQQMMQEVQQAAQEAEMGKAELEKLSANLETDKAKFEAYVAKQLAQLAQKDAQLTVKELEERSEEILEADRQAYTQDMANSISAFNQEMAQAVQDINQRAAQFVQQAMETINDIKTEKGDTPRIIRIDSEKVNGKLTAVPVYEDIDEMEEKKAKRKRITRIESKRENGRLVAVPIYEE